MLTAKVYVILALSTAVFRNVALALPYFVLLPSLFATSPAAGILGCCGCAGTRAWMQGQGTAF